MSLQYNEEELVKLIVCYNRNYETINKRLNSGLVFLAAVQTFSGNLVISFVKTTFNLHTPSPNYVWMNFFRTCNMYGSDMHNYTCWVLSHYNIESIVLLEITQHQPYVLEQWQCKHPSCMIRLFDDPETTIETIERNVGVFKLPKNGNGKVRKRIIVSAPLNRSLPLWFWFDLLETIFNLKLNV